MFTCVGASHTFTVRRAAVFVSFYGLNLMDMNFDMSHFIFDFRL